jgi:methylmalonyl-CoA mutase cobalamin-binding domain/chain
MLMDNINILEKLMNTLVALNRERTLQVCKEALTAHRPEDVIEALSEGLSIIGNKFETHEYFLSELMMAGVIMKDAQTIIRPHLTKEVTKRAGKVVIGTVEGDLHDIGKNITIALLEGKGFEVIDLGVNVPKSTFVQSVREEKPDVVGLSALLRATVPEMGQVITALQDAGLRDKVTVIVGGLPLNEDYAKKLGADYYAKDAWKGVEIIMQAVAPT